MLTQTAISAGCAERELAATLFVCLILVTLIFVLIPFSKWRLPKQKMGSMCILLFFGILPGARGLGSPSGRVDYFIRGDITF
jgi:hypothetical protein